MPIFQYIDIQIVEAIYEGIALFVSERKVYGFVTTESRLVFETRA